MKKLASYAALEIRSWVKGVFRSRRPATEMESSSCTKVYERPTYGRVLEIALTGSNSWEVSSRSCKILEEEVARHRPQYLVINLLGFDSVFGNDLIGTLVAGAVAMLKLGAERKTRILAAGRTAAELDRILPLIKLASFFGGRTYTDLESALGQTAGMQDEPKDVSRVKEQATRDSGTTEPMPELRSQLQLDRTFCPQEYQVIKLGVIPQNMDDRWFIYLEKDWLYLHRGTGSFARSDATRLRSFRYPAFCIYQVRLEPAGDSYRIAETWVNRDSKQYDCIDDKYDADFLLWLIDSIMLGKEVAMPRPPWLKDLMQDEPKDVSRGKEQATRDSGDTEPMPELRSQLQLDRTFSPQEYQVIKLGVIPQNMDDKWFIYLEKDWLYLHRRTGYCIFQMRLEPAGDSYRIAETWVNRDSKQYNCIDDKDDADFLLWLIDFIMLGKEVAMPRPPWLKDLIGPP